MTKGRTAPAGVIREIQVEIQRHQREITRLNGQLDDARTILSGKLIVIPDAASTARRRPIRKASSVGHALNVLRDRAMPMDVDRIITRINERFGVEVSKPTLVSSLSRYVRNKDTFTRPEPGVYGLIEFETKKDAVPMEETIAS